MKCDDPAAGKLADTAKTAVLPGWPFCLKCLYLPLDKFEFPVYAEEDVVSRWENTFNTIEADIAHFINENPNPDIYCPTGRTNRNRVYELLMDIHSGNLKQALDKIDLFKANPIGVGFQGPKGYDYEYIERWINEQER